MSLQRSLLRAFCLLVCCATQPTLAAAASAVAPDALARLEARLQTHSDAVQKLQQEFEFTQYKRQSSEEKLKQLQDEKRTREVQLARMKESLGDSPTAEQKEALDNEAQRIALADLAIKSSIAAIGRLERKEQELQQALAEATKNIAQTQKEISAAIARADAERQARDRAMQQQLAALQQENERLRLAMEEEARRAEEAARQAEEARREAARRAEEQALAMAAQLAAEQQAAVSTQTELATTAAPASAAAEATPPVAAALTNTAPAAPATVAKARVKSGRTPVVDDAPDLSQVVLEGEPPIYRDEDTIKVTIRSRSIDTPVTMVPIAPNLYRAEVSVDPGRAFFDVRNRRYRGYFPEKADNSPYVFYYDMSGERPKMLVLTKSNDEQMISNVKDPF